MKGRLKRVASVVLATVMVIGGMPAVTAKAEVNFYPSAGNIVLPDTIGSTGVTVVNGSYFWEECKSAEDVDSLTEELTKFNAGDDTQDWINKHQSVINDAKVDDGAIRVASAVLYEEGKTIRYNTYDKNGLNQISKADLANAITNGKVYFYRGDKACSHQVTFDVNAEDVDPINSISVVSGNVITTDQVPAEPVRDGYVFSGWFTSATAQNDTQWIPLSYSVNTPVTLYAKWVKTSAAYTITLSGYEKPVLVGDNYKPLLNMEASVSPTGYYLANSWKLVYEDADSTEKPDVVFGGKNLYEGLSKIVGGKYYYYYVTSFIKPSANSEEYIPATDIAYSVEGKVSDAIPLDDNNVGILIPIGLSQPAVGPVEPEKPDVPDGATYDMSGVAVGDIVTVGDKLKIFNETKGNFVAAYFNFGDVYWGIEPTNSFEDGGMKETVKDTDTWVVGDRIGNLNNLPADYFKTNTEFVVTDVKEVPTSEGSAFKYWDIYFEPYAVKDITQEVSFSQSGSMATIKTAQDAAYDYYYRILGQSEVDTGLLPEVADNFKNSMVGRMVRGCKVNTADLVKITEAKANVELIAKKSVIAVYKIAKNCTGDVEILGVTASPFEYGYKHEEKWVRVTDTEQLAREGFVAVTAQDIAENGKRLIEIFKPRITKEGCYVVGADATENTTTSDKYWVIELAGQDYKWYAVSDSEILSTVNKEDALLMAVENTANKVYYVLDAEDTIVTLYTVIYDFCEKASTSAEVVCEGVTIKNAEPIISGYTFNGWYLDKNYTKPFDVKTPITGYLRLYAKLTKNQSGGGTYYPPATSSPGGSTDTKPETKPETKPDTTVTTNPDGSKTETTVTTNPDGSKTETSVTTSTNGDKTETVKTEDKETGKVTVEEKVTAQDGTVTETKTETAKDGSVTEVSKEVKPDGSVTEVSKEVKPDGSSKEVSKEINADGSTVETRKTTKADGTATSKIVAKEAGSEDIITVSKTENKNGDIAKVSAKISTDTASITKADVNRIKELAGTTSLNVKLEVKDSKGKLDFKVQVNTKDLKANTTLYTYKYDSKTKQYNLVKASDQKVKLDGNASLSCDFDKIPSTQRYELVTKKQADDFNKQILATVKPSVSKKTIKEDKSINFKMDKGLNLDNVKKITYTTSNKKVATVNKNGKITAKDEGKVTVQAKVTLLNGKTKTVKMTITVN